MEILSITEIWKLLKWLPGFILRRIFTQKRLADLVIVDVRARNNSVEVNLGDISSFDIYFQIINMTPFEIELDRAEFIFYCAGTRLKTQHIKKSVYRPGEVALLCIEDEISVNKANQIAKSLKTNSSRIDLSCEFNCKLHNFTKKGHLDGINVQFINDEYRINKLNNEQNQF